MSESEYDDIFLNLPKQLREKEPKKEKVMSMWSCLHALHR